MHFMRALLAPMQALHSRFIRLSRHARTLRLEGRRLALAPLRSHRKEFQMNDTNELAQEGLSRRDFLGGGLGVAAALSLSTAGTVNNAHAAPEKRNHRKESSTMSTITTKDGTEIFFKDWGPKSAQPIVFHHGWPLTADDWDTQMLYFLSKGYRVVAHDRRGHGRSSQVGEGHDMDHYAADASAVFEHLDLKNAVHIGHSTGGGQAARYVARYGQPQGRVAKLVLIGAVPPIMLKTPSNPGGLPIEVFDGLRKQLADNRSQFYIDLASGPFYGFNRPGAKPSQGIIENWWRQGMMGGTKAHYDGIRAFSETDFTEDLKVIDVPTLVMHGDDDQIVPIADSALLSVKLLKKGTLKVYEKFPHGMCTTHADVINPDLLAFVKS
jgi:non-heme chloroperoxidase